MNKLIAFALFVGILGCTEGIDNVEKVNNISNPPISSRSTILNVDPSNSNNPMDSVGVIHNELLDVVAFDLDFETLNIAPFLNEYTENERGWYDFDQMPTDSMVSVIWGFCLEDDFNGLIDELASSNGYSVNLVNQLKELLTVLNVNREDVEIADLIDSIIVKETQFALQTSLLLKEICIMGLRQFYDILVVTGMLC